MQHHGAVVLVPEGEAAIVVLRIGPLGLLSALRLTVEPDELLDMLGGAVQSDIEEVDLVLCSGNAGQRTDLGVAELALGQRLREQRQPRQRSGDPYLLPCRVGIDAARPAQPVGAGQRPLRGPDLAAVELGDEDKQPVRGGMDVGGKGRDGSGESVVVHGAEIVRRNGMQVGHGF